VGNRLGEGREVQAQDAPAHIDTGSTGTTSAPSLNLPQFPLVDRRELLKAIPALAALPMVKSVERAAVEPGDVVVIESDQELHPAVVARIEAMAGEVFPGCKVLVLHSSLHLKVVRKS
jgi:hypothetical protein